MTLLEAVEPLVSSQIYIYNNLGKTTSGTFSSLFSRVEYFLLSDTVNLNSPRPVYPLWSSFLCTPASTVSEPRP